MVSRPHRRVSPVSRCYFQLILGISVVTGGLMGIAPHAGAQITFAWEGQSPDVGAYSTVETCLGMVRRVHREYVPPFPPGRPDTLPPELRIPENSTPQPVFDAAERCSQKFSVESILEQSNLDISTLENAFVLLLYSDRTTDAMTLAERWLQSYSTEDDSVRIVLTSRLASFLIDVRPRRFAEAVKLIETLELPRSWYLAMSVMGKVFVEARQLQDTARTESTARWLVQMPTIVGEEVTRSQLWQDPRIGVGRFVVEAQIYLNGEQLLSKLRTSTDAYRDYLNVLITQSGFPGRDEYSGQEELTKAKPIIADWWFPAKPATSVPTQGTVSLVIAKTGDWCDRCLGEALDLRRLKEKFPTLEITMLTRTRGSQGTIREPVDPEVEAKFLDSLYRKHLKMPITLAVENGKFWRLPDPDHRRINEPGPNHDWLPTIGLFGRRYLIDKEGNIVQVQRIRGDGTDEYRMLEILFERPAK